MILFTSYSFITAILVSNLFFVFFVCLSKSDKILLHIPLRVFAVFGTALLVKFLFPVEFVHAKVISSFEIFPTIIRIMEKKLFTIGGFACCLDRRDILHFVEQNSFLQAVNP